MADIAIVSAAYWGDVMPLVPIAEELSHRGHRVTLAVPRGFHDVLRGGPFELVHLGTDFSPQELVHHGVILDRADSPRGMRAAADLWVNRLCIDPAGQILDVLDGLAPDLWFVHPSLYWLVEMAVAPTGTPVAVGHLFPMLLPSAVQPPPMLPVSAGRTLNHLGWRIARSLMGRMMYDREINHLRAQRALPAAPANVGFGWERAERTLLLTSRHYWPAPSDRAGAVVQTGFTVWDGGRTPLPEDLETYLDDDPAPVLITFGTSAATNAGDAFTQVARSVESAGHRPLLLVGNERNRATLADRKDAWTFAPLPRVLDRCRAIVHAGGHGSTAAALHAGVPQLALPMGFDQHGHARRIQELGVGTSLPFRRRSPARLTAALRGLLDGRHDSAASDLARRLAEEDGPATAADHLDACLTEGDGREHGHA
jgi:rhamnosyltransferase subunit B